MAANSSPIWYALPNTPTSASVGLWPSAACPAPCTQKSPCPFQVSPFFGRADAINSEDNNIVPNGRFGSCSSKAGCLCPTAAGVANKHYSCTVGRLAMDEKDDGADRCNKVELAHADSIKYALELLGDSRTSSCSTQMNWDDSDDDMAIDVTHGVVNVDVTGVNCSAVNSMQGDNLFSSPPRLRTATKTCPAAPVRRGPAIRLVPAEELGKH